MAARTAPKKLSAKPTIQELRAYDGTLYVKNHSRHTVTCNTPTLQFTLEAHGTDGSIKVLPKECLDQAGFQKIIRKQQVSVSPDYEQESIDASLRVDEARDADLAKINAITEENSSKKDLVAKECLISKETVFQTQQEIDDLVPPLLEQYKDRAHEFIGSIVQSASGETEVVFNRVQIG